MQRQPIEVQTLYAELVERATAFEAQRAIGHVPGTFVSKQIKGNDYYYFQSVGPGGAKRQTYLGRRTPELEAVSTRHASERALAEEDLADLERLASLLRAGGAMRIDAASARVIRALADSGTFRLGGVLVGTHAFIALGNVLGVAWSGSGVRTQDIDIAAEHTISVALEASDAADLPGALESLNMGFLPVPAFDPRGATTSFKVRGQGLRVDLLAPAMRNGQRDVHIRRLNAWAQPLKFLDYLLDGPIRAAVIDGGVSLVNVPDAARFALHKLIVANERPAADHAKRDKDLWQAAQVLDVLVEDRPGDVTRAWSDLVAYGGGWERRAIRGITALSAADPQIAAHASELLGLNAKAKASAMRRALRGIDTDPRDEE